MRRSNFEQTPESKRQQIEKIFSVDNDGEKIKFTPDALVALSGSLVEKKTSAGDHLRYAAPSYAEVDNNGLVSGGKARVLAVAEAHKYFPEATIITNSRDKGETGRPTHAAVYAKELQAKAVAPEKIMTEENSVATIDGMYELCQLANQNGWKIIAIITNEYHLPRVREQFAQLEELAQKADRADVAGIKNFKAGGGMIIPIAAEEILVVRDPRYRGLIEMVKDSEPHQKRLAAEAKGLADLESGAYEQKRPDPKKDDV